jgi:HprK-related kinase A
MKLLDLAPGEIARRLQGQGLFLQTGPFSTVVRSSVPAVAEGIATLYADNATADDPAFADFHVSLEPADGVRRWFRRQCLFRFDGVMPFNPLPLRHSVPVFEWGLNWCIANHAQQFLLFHAAAIERNGRVAIFPGVPGAGKSTLCAGLVGRGGWRLLSDELAIVDLKTGLVVPLARPISLKNESIAVIRGFVPDAVMSRETHDTVKGTVALVKAPVESVRRVDETAKPAWIIFPKYVAGAAPTLEPEKKAAAFIDLADNAFNYSIHGETGFRVTADMVELCDCYRFTYSRLDDAIRVFAALEPPA